MTTKPALELLNVEQVARLLGLSKAAVRSHFRQGRLPGRKLGRRWRCTRTALEKTLESNHGRE